MRIRNPAERFRTRQVQQRPPRSLERPVRALRALLALLVAASGTTALQAQITPEQVTQLQTVTSAVISPDARLVAYTLSQPRAPERTRSPGCAASPSCGSSRQRAASRVRLCAGP